MEPITVVTPFTMAQPRSDPDNAVAGADSRGSTLCAAPRGQIIVETSATKEMIFRVTDIFLVLSGGR
jgi:hypothetical protein